MDLNSHEYMPDWIKSFDGRLEVSPPLADEQLGQVPAKRGVFALLGDRDEPIILLTAADIRARLRNRLAAPLDDRRRKTVDLREITRKVLWRLTFSHFETDLAYFELVRRMWPKDYGQMLAWRRGWFVHVNPEEQFPRFVRTSEVSAGPGRYFGPFADGRSATHFVDAVQDTFDLCRDYSCLRLSPGGQQCTYAQMGRCSSPCDGTISMADYRKLVAEAAEFAAGRREHHKRRLTEQMAAAALALQYERASALKVRISRLEEFDKPACRFVAPVEQFRYVICQRGGTGRKVRVFLVNAGAITSAGELDYPLDAARLDKVLKRMAALAARPLTFKQAELYRMGLVANYLFCSEDRRGLILRWEPSLKAQQLCEQVESVAGRLKLRAGKGRKKEIDDSGASSGPPDAV